MNEQGCAEGGYAEKEPATGERAPEAKGFEVAAKNPGSGGKSGDEPDADG